jgi:hypothetical protein
MNRTSWIAALGLAVSLLPAAPALAADHLDGASVKQDPSTDINDVYSWMSTDRTKVYLAMTVFPAADKATAKFSTAAYYVFHTTSRTGNGAATPTDVVCGFDAAQKVSCWVGSATNFVSGDASNTAGISSTDGKVKVFAGVRKDHFFFNLDGYNQVRANVKGAAAALTFNANGCPTAPVAALTAQRTQLALSPAGGAAVDFFANLNTLAIVLEVDTALLTPGGTLLSVYAATHRKG